MGAKQNTQTHTLGEKKNLIRKGANKDKTFLIENKEQKAASATSWKKCFDFCFTIDVNYKPEMRQNQHWNMDCDIVVVIYCWNCSEIMLVANMTHNFKRETKKYLLWCCHGINPFDKEKWKFWATILSIWRSVFALFVLCTTENWWIRCFSQLYCIVIAFWPFSQKAEH